MNAPTNGNTPAAATVAERHGYGRLAQLEKPAPATMPAPGRAGRPAVPSLGAKLRPWLLAALVGALAGAAAMGYVAYQTMPIRATEVDRVFADVNGDGAPDLIVSGWVVYGPAPKAAGQ